jgi:hypothetical protein
VGGFLLNALYFLCYELSQNLSSVHQVLELLGWLNVPSELEKQIVSLDSRLIRVELKVSPSFLYQFFMSAALCDGTMFNNKNLVGLPDST